MKSIVYRMGLVAAMLCLLSVTASAQRGAGNANNANKDAAVATPRTPDGHPDLSGLWNGGNGAGGGGGAAAEPDETDPNSFAPSVFAARHTGGLTGAAALINFERDNTIIRRMSGNRPQYKPQYWEIVKHNDQNGNTEDPAGNCMPAGVPRIGVPAQISQSANQLIFLYVAGGAAAFPATYRVIPIDGRQHTKLDDLDGTWNGESIGHWEGDTMVVDTIGFNSSTWLDIQGYIHSEDMHVIERFTRNGNTLTLQTTVDDPVMLLKPWVEAPRTVRLNPDPKAVVPETPPCSERDYAHVVTKEHH
jgi:hypothetical protein